MFGLGVWMVVMIKIRVVDQWEQNSLIPPSLLHCCAIPLLPAPFLFLLHFLNASFLFLLHFLNASWRHLFVRAAAFNDHFMHLNDEVVCMSFSHDASILAIGFSNGVITLVHFPSMKIREQPAIE